MYSEGEEEMPPGQLILRCQKCELLRPCKEWPGGWLCVDCCPVNFDEHSSAGQEAATDGGVER